MSQITPEILRISRKTANAVGQVAYVATIQYPGEKPSRVQFVGTGQHAARDWVPGPVVMLLESGVQTLVDESGRFGRFGESWMRRFFGSES